MSNPNQSQKSESPSARQRRLQDEAENKGDIHPAVTIDDDGKAVRKKPEEVRRNQDAKQSSMLDTRVIKPKNVDHKTWEPQTQTKATTQEERTQSNTKPKSKSKSKSKHAVKRFWESD